MKLGDLSAQYESNGDPGVIADTPGDAGGKSYGAYQMIAGTVERFIIFLGDRNDELWAWLGPFTPGTDEFDARWREVAEKMPEAFLEAQRAFIEAEFYEPAIEKLIAGGYEPQNWPEAVHQVIWSAAVQYGPRWIVELFDEAGGVNVSIEELIRNIYNVRASDEWTDGSPSLRPGLRSRFESECEKAISMLGC